MSFEGASGYIGLGNPAELNFSGQITLEAWIRPDAKQGVHSDIIAHGVNQSDTKEVFLRIEGDQIYQAGSWGGTLSEAASVVFLVPAEDRGKWVHLVGTYDGSAWNLYRNGVRVATKPHSKGAALVNDADWAIGNRTVGDRPFKGDIDEVAIFNRALTPKEISDQYNAAMGGISNADMTSADIDTVSTEQIAPEPSNNWQDIPDKGGEPFWKKYRKLIGSGLIVLGLLIVAGFIFYVRRNNPSD